MERRKFVKSLLPLAALFSSKSVLDPHAELHGELYKGKRLVVSDPGELQAMCKKREFSLPRFDSDKSIVDEMRRFVDMGEGHLDELGNEIYGCVYENGSYSIASFAPPHGNPKEYRVLLCNERAA